MNHAILVLQEQRLVLADLYAQARGGDFAGRNAILFQLDREIRETDQALRLLCREARNYCDPMVLMPSVLETDMAGLLA